MHNNILIKYSLWVVWSHFHQQVRTVTCTEVKPYYLQRLIIHFVLETETRAPCLLSGTVELERFMHNEGAGNFIGPHYSLFSTRWAGFRLVTLFHWEGGKCGDWLRGTIHVTHRRSSCCCKDQDLQCQWILYSRTAPSWNKTPSHLWCGRTAWGLCGNQLQVVPQLCYREVQYTKGKPLLHTSQWHSFGGCHFLGWWEEVAHMWSAVPQWRRKDKQYDRAHS